MVQKYCSTLLLRDLFEANYGEGCCTGQDDIAAMSVYDDGS